MNNENFNQLLENYKDGVPVKIERSTLVSLAITEIAVVILAGLILKIIKQL